MGVGWEVQHLRKDVRTLYTVLLLFSKDKKHLTILQVAQSHQNQILKTTKYSVNAGSTSKSKIIDKHRKYDPVYYTNVCINRGILNKFLSDEYIWQYFYYTFFFVLVSTVSILDNENKSFFKNKLLKLFFQGEERKIIVTCWIIT